MQEHKEQNEVEKSVLDLMSDKNENQTITMIIDERLAGNHIDSQIHCRSVSGVVI